MSHAVGWVEVRGMAAAAVAVVVVQRLSRWRRSRQQMLGGRRCRVEWNRQSKKEVSDREYYLETARSDTHRQQRQQAGGQQEGNRQTDRQLDQKRQQQRQHQEKTTPKRKTTDTQIPNQPAAHARQPAADPHEHTSTAVCLS